MSSASVTETCKLGRNERNGVTIDVMDSPGLFDTKKTHEEVAIDVVQAVACMHPGPTAVLYVISLANRYTQEENGVYERLKSLLDKHVTEYMIVIFTRGSDLRQNKKTIEDFLSRAPSELRKVLEECGDRYVVFENFADDKDSQVDRLLQMVRTLSAAHGGQPYMCPKYGEVGEKMNKEVDKRMKKAEKRELQRKKYVQDLKMMMKQAQEQAETLRTELEKQAKKRDEEIKMSSMGREDKLTTIMEAMQKHELIYEASELKQLLYEMEKEKSKELNDAEQLSKGRIEVFEKQTKENYEKRIAEAIEESKKREANFEGEMKKLKDSIANRGCVIS
ncbi:hypothetical protein C0Q70_06450 [Pomacea canaliculata]|uniref:AIG1-type G domain-containing protein n=2 Tax=Pomacea canaliculata TaxID=400727 RepID=A0A2T7PP16_POMCA|nr:hypothetical protein C0Q70_06450 [Pomacea canaliculata]